MNRVQCDTKTWMTSIILVLIVCLSACGGQNPLTQGSISTEKEIMDNATLPGTGLQEGEVADSLDLRHLEEAMGKQGLLLAYDEGDESVIICVYRQKSVFTGAYLERYRTEALNESFWNGGSLCVKDHHEGMINLVDLNIADARLMMLKEAEKDYGKQEECVAFYRTGEEPIYMPKSLCGKTDAELDSADIGLFQLFLLLEKDCGDNIQHYGNIPQGQGD